MSVTLDFGAQNVKDGEGPHYTEDSTLPKYAQSLSNIQRSYGFSLDAQTVSGIMAVTSAVSGPNKLVATGADGLISNALLQTTTLVTTTTGATVPAPYAGIVLVSSDLSKNAALTVDTTGALITTPIPFSTANITYLTDGSNTYWITFTSADAVLAAQVAKTTTTQTSFTLTDTALNLWNVTLDAGGVFRTTNVGLI